MPLLKYYSKFSAQCQPPYIKKNRQNCFAKHFCTAKQAFFVQQPETDFTANTKKTAAENPQPL